MNSPVIDSAPNPTDAGVPDSGVADAGPTSFDGGAGSFTFDFATAALENPLSANGLWSNNTQGVGGNLPPGNLTSMMVGLASDGVTRIAMDTHDPASMEYSDSFVFVPGFPGDQFIEGVIYKEPGYNPNANDSNHESELILGCSSTTGLHVWNEFLVNAAGGVQIMYLAGAQADSYELPVVTGTVGFGVIPVDGDRLRAERRGNVLSLYLNDQLWLRHLGGSPGWVAHGSGIGIAGFTRTGAVHSKFGFRA